MPRIPEYTQGIIRQRAVPNTVNMQAISDAGATARGVAQVTDIGAQLAIKMKQADDATAVNEAVIAKQRSDMEWFEEVKKSRENNPDKFAKDLEPEFKKRDEELAKTLPSSAAKRAFRESTARLNLQNFETALNWENTRKTQIFSNRIAQSENDLRIIAARAGREGKDLDPALFKNADASTAAAATVFPQDRLYEINQGMRGAVVGDYLESLASVNPQKAKQFLDEKKYDKELGADKIQALYKTIDAEQERLSAGYRDELRNEAKDIERAASLGLTVPEETILSLAKRSDAAGIEGMGDNLRKYAGIQSTASDFAKKSFKDQAVDIKALEAKIEAGDLSKVDEYSALANVLQTKTKMIADDPWGYYSAHDIVHSPEPVNFQNPAEVQAAFDQRRVDSARIKELEGSALPLLTKQEIAQIKGIYEEDGGESAANILASVGSGLTFEERRSLSQQFDSADVPLIAAALNQPPNVAEGILLGAKAKGDVTPAKAREAVNLKLEGMVFDPEANETIQTAVFSYYKKLSLDEGDTSKEVDEKRMSRAIEEVVGRPAEISINGNPSKVFLYREDGKFIKPNVLEDALTGFDDQVLRKASGSMPMTSDGMPVDPQDIKDKAVFTTYGDGQYIALYPGLGYIMNEKGQPFIFDVREMQKAYKEMGLKPKAKSKFGYGGIGIKG